MVKRKIIIKNNTGLHARPASQLVKKANTFKSNIKIIGKNTEVNAKSIVGVLSLGASKGRLVEITAEGEDESIAVKELAELIESFTD